MAKIQYGGGVKPDIKKLPNRGGRHWTLGRSGTEGEPGWRHTTGQRPGRRVNCEPCCHSPVAPPWWMGSPEAKTSMALVIRADLDVHVSKLDLHSDRGSSFTAHSLQCPFRWHCS